VRQTAKLRAGDLVETKTPEEILSALDAEGALDHLPFMPEMLEFCGKRFRVAKKVVKNVQLHGNRHEHASIPNGRCRDAGWTPLLRPRS